MALLSSAGFVAHALRNEQDIGQTGGSCRLLAYSHDHDPRRLFDFSGDAMFDGATPTTGYAGHPKASRSARLTGVLGALRTAFFSLSFMSCLFPRGMVAVDHCCLPILRVE